MPNFIQNPYSIPISKGFWLLIIFLLTGFFDYFIRNSEAAWTSHFLLQTCVTYSPIIYLISLVILLLSVSEHLPQFSKQAYISIVLLSYSIFIILQILTRHQGVGSASYSIVSPLFISGIPAAIMTFILYFQEQRNLLPSVIIIIVCLLWLFGTIAFDAVYKLQGGYRGQSPIDNIPIISTCYWLITNGITFFFMIAFFVLTPTVFLIALCVLFLLGLKKIYRSKPENRLKVSAIVFSLSALNLQICNWSLFMMD